MEAWSFGKLLRSSAKLPSDLAPADPDPHFSASWHPGPYQALCTGVHTPHLCSAPQGLGPSTQLT